MTRFVDICGRLDYHFPDGKFDLSSWRAYIDNTSVPGLGELVEADFCASGYDYENMVVPVIERALAHPEQISAAREAFGRAANRVLGCFEKTVGKEPEADIILYLGLCNGAGWATQLAGIPVVLLGVEKILELGWQDVETLFALTAHELGHIWHMTSGGCFGGAETAAEEAVFQLYSEGVAMLCEQLLRGDERYYHQDRDGWLAWCESSEAVIRSEFLRRVRQGESVQDFFGDWSRFQGRPDVGYYLGCRFVRWLLERYEREDMLRLLPRELTEEFCEYASRP